MGIFNIFARMTLDTAHFDAGAKRVESAAAALGKRIGGYFAAGSIGYGLLSFGRAAAQAAGDISDLSEQLGITIEEVQQLQRVSRQSGVDLGKYAEALGKIKRARAEALSGNTTARERFSALGVSPDADPLNILRAVGSAKSPEEVAAAYSLIGEKAGKLKESLKGIKELGPLELITADNAKALDDAADSLAEVGSGLRAIAANAIGGVVRLWNVMGQAADPSALPLPDRFNTGQDEAVETNMARLGDEFRARDRRIREAREGYNDPLNFGSFRSSTANQRASIGGFFIGADQTARMDIERQQLQAQKMIADRMDRIEKQVAKILEGS